MTKQIIECVPNFSEGRNQQVIDAIADAIRATPGVSLLDVDAGASTNRTVYTFVGNPIDVIEGALSGARAAYQLIDMTKHKGEHKRLGAMDVCPFIPVAGVTMDDCVRCAHEFGRRVALELNIPIFMYGYASKQDYRKEVPQIRAGEYEQLATRLLDPIWAPDYGRAEFVPKWGASIVGARKFLIAYNVNLVSTKEQANRIALIIRANQTNPEKVGRLPATQAMGWYLKEQNIAQVTVNILDHEITGIHDVYEEVIVEATKLKLPVTGSEIVGMVPLQSLLDVAQFYIERENLFVLEEDQKIHLAINRLGLSSISQFEPNKRIIEYMVREPESTSRLINQTVTGFVRMVGDRTTAPGGGSVGANVGALGAGLASMVAKLSYGKKIFEKNDPIMRRLIPILHESVEKILKLVDEDTDAFTEYSEAVKLPANNEQEKQIRLEAIEKGIRTAISVPLRLAKLSNHLWSPIEELISVFHLPTTSDLQVSCQCLRTAVYAAYYNVQINLDMDDAAHLREEISKEIETELATAESKCQQMLSLIEQRNQK
ncbi:hypothetical protein RDWZM_005239 [Blomia tropicalis]|uniref:Formimidoyltransferase-cyclodeaminase n=1 Tax=Blomia tropicalis TaxID=40697 RepID=A0A9Q0M5S2_BLOTA|nr:hypothetical protein RDWZM_005239 [Blomia tropicalis]